MATISRREIAALALRANPEATQPELPFLRELVARLNGSDARDLPSEYAFALAILGYSGFEQQLLILSSIAVRMDLFEVALRLARLADDLGTPSRPDILMHAAAMAGNPRMEPSLRDAIRASQLALRLSERQRTIFDLSFDPDAAEPKTSGAEAYRRSRWPGTGLPADQRRVRAIVIDDDSRPRSGAGWAIIGELAVAGYLLRRVTEWDGKAVDPRWAPPGVPFVSWRKSVEASHYSLVVVPESSDLYEQSSFVLSAVYRLLTPGGAQEPTPQLSKPEHTIHEHEGVLNLQNIREQRSRVNAQREVLRELMSPPIAAMLRKDPEHAFDAAVKAARQYLKTLPDPSLSNDLEGVVHVAVKAALNELFLLSPAGPGEDSSNAV